ncbi:DNRLRE domain-containing protein [candidate division KSB1 bacterium]|nr:DNRLRE domain-containing protein [candidate division KSB1 bacterium]
MKNTLVLYAFILLFPLTSVLSQPIIADHTCIDINQIPVAAIEQAKEQLHIGYGYTSHGSQIPSGMSGLVDFMNSKGYPHNLFQFNNTGSGGALHLFSGSGYDAGDLELDAGYYPSWVNETRDFLGEVNAQGRGSIHPAYNVIMWAWCGQLSGYSQSDVYNQYLNDMNQLELDYPGITFVYMTGHADGSGLEGDLHQNNQTIRNFCETNDKVLFDFYDIECYDPDGNYFGDQHVTDECYYDGGNWGQEWQNAHVMGVDWYRCDPAHTEHVVGNMKAYAIWWLWARLAGWAGPVTDDTPPSIPQNLLATVISETQVDLTWDPSTDEESGVSRYRVYRNGSSIATTSSTSYSDMTCVPGQTYSYQVSAINGGGMESEASSPVEVSTPTDDQPPSTPTGLTATASSSTQIDLTWNAATDNTAVAGYRVFRDGVEIGTASTLAYTDTGLSPSTTYQYQVSAFDAVGNESGLSATASATTLEPSQEKNTIRLETQDQVDDSFLFASDPDTRFGSEPYVSDIDRFIIKFNLPPELNGKRILSAKLFLYVWNQSNYQDNQYLDIFRVTRSWDESSVTWVNANETEQWSAAGGDYDTTAPVAQIVHQQGEENWNHTFYPPVTITNLVQEWAGGTLPNNGLLVINDSQTGIGFKASEYDDGHRPYLNVEYTDFPTHIGNFDVPESFQICKNYPNPFNGSTIIEYAIQKKNHVEIKIFDLNGREVTQLFSGEMPQGVHRIRFAPDRLASGVYLYTVRTGQFQKTGKMLLVR